MKLYTEEQVRNMLDTFILFTGNEDANDYIEYMTPIELPSDEEIESKSKHWGLASHFFYEGADWVRNQLINTKEK